MPYDACGKVCAKLSAVAALVDVAAVVAVASAMIGAASVPPSFAFGVFSMNLEILKSFTEHFCLGFKVQG
jgi:hypothetical protein